MKAMFLLLILAALFSACNNSPGFSGVNNNDTVVVFDDFRQAAPAFPVDSTRLKDSTNASLGAG